MLTFLLKTNCNNANSHPIIFKLQLFPIQLNPLCLQGKFNWTGSLCQPFPMSQHTLCTTTEPGTGCLSLIPSSPIFLSPLCNLPFPPSTHILFPHEARRWPASPVIRGEINNAINKSIWESRTCQSWLGHRGHFLSHYAKAFHSEIKEVSL